MCPIDAALTRAPELIGQAAAEEAAREMLQAAAVTIKRLSRPRMKPKRKSLEGFDLYDDRCGQRLVQKVNCELRLRGAAHTPDPSVRSVSSRSGSRGGVNARCEIAQDEARVRACSGSHRQVASEEAKQWSKLW